MAWRLRDTLPQPPGARPLNSRELPKAPADGGPVGLASTRGDEGGGLRTGPPHETRRVCARL